MSRFLVSPAAAADIEGIERFLDEHAPHATVPVLDALLGAMRRLADAPGLGQLRDDLVAEPLRLYAVFSYLVVYRVTERLEVVRVLHAARDVARILETPRGDDADRRTRG